MRLTTLSPTMGTDIVATTPEEFDAQCAAKYKFTATPKPFVPHYPQGHLGGKFEVTEKVPDVLDSHHSGLSEGMVLTESTHIWDESLRVPVTENTKILPLKTSMLEPYCPAGYVGRKSSPLITVGPRILGSKTESVGFITGLRIARSIAVVPTLRQVFEQTRDIENTPQESESTWSNTKKTRALRGYLKSRDIYPKTQKEIASHQMDWYAFRCPSQATERSKPDEPMLPYQVVSTVYIRNLCRAETKFGKNRQPTLFESFRLLLPMEPITIRKDLYIKVFRESSRNVTMHAGTDMFGMQPIGKYWTGKAAPIREDSPIDFMGVNPATLSLRERAWWSGEIYRYNVRKDGMIRAKAELVSIVAEFMKVGRDTVTVNAKSDAPLTKARGKIAALTQTVRKPSPKGSGFNGISGDWNLKFQPKLTAKWMVPWLIG